ncbi:hypothetical protein [Acidiphilium acidophilum]|jgi:hypothetical protein
MSIRDHQIAATQTVPDEAAEEFGQSPSKGRFTPGECQNYPFAAG